MACKGFVQSDLELLNYFDVIDSKEVVWITTRTDTLNHTTNLDASARGARVAHLLLPYIC